MVKASMVLAGGAVITFDRGRKIAEAVAIRGNGIEAVGSTDDVKVFAGPETRWIDCRERAVLPGFHDAHFHIMASASRIINLDCGPEHVRSIPEIEHLVRDRVSSARRGEWVLGYGYDEFNLHEKRHPNRHDLDRAAPVNPVRLGHRSGHACVLNTLGLELAGIRMETAEPDGVIIERELETGEPNGILLGRSGWWEEGVLTGPKEGELRNACRQLGRELSACGVTAVQDAGADNGVNEWRSLEGMVELDALQCRVTMMPGLGEFEQCLERGDSLQVELGPVKVMLDETRGYLNPPLSTLLEKTSKLYMRGIPIAIHAVEGGQLDAAVSILETLRAKLGPAKALNRIEHCAIAPPEMLGRLRGTGAAVVTHPAFIYYHGDRYLSTVLNGDLPWLYAFSGMETAGLTVAAASDSPVAPMDPLRGVVAAVSRRTKQGACISMEQAVKVESAIGAYTLNAARVGALDGRTGSIEPGKDADLVVLDRDPRACSPSELDSVRVLLTIARGRVVYDAGAL